MSAAKINSLLSKLEQRRLMLVSRDAARRVIVAMNEAVGSSTRCDSGNFYAWRLEVEGVGVLRVVVDKSRSWQPAVVAFDEAAPGELAFYLDNLNMRSAA